MGKKQWVVVGSTGQLGKLVLDLWEKVFYQQSTITALMGHTQGELLRQQIEEFKPQVAGLSDAASADTFCESNRRENGLFLKGTQEINDWLEGLGPEHVVLLLNSGVELLPGVLGAVRRGADLIISNKEFVVTAGSLLRDALKYSSAICLPIDSEHHAIWCCLPSQAQKTVGKFLSRDVGIQTIFLMGSGGNFWGHAFSDLEGISPERAWAHPIWPMGKKNSIDSATFMNKGLELIEAAILFGAETEEIRVIRHPQAKIHGAVAYRSGHLLLHYSPPSMRITMESSLHFLQRASEKSGFIGESTVFQPEHCFEQWSSCVFEVLESSRVPALCFAQQALKGGDLHCLAFDAINTALVEAFMEEKIKFSQILPLFHLAWDKKIEDRPCDALGRIALHKMLKDQTARLIENSKRDCKRLSPMRISQFEEMFGK